MPKDEEIVGRVSTTVEYEDGSMFRYIETQQYWDYGDGEGDLNPDTWPEQGEWIGPEKFNDTSHPAYGWLESGGQEDFHPLQTFGAREYGRKWLGITRMKQQVISVIKDETGA